MCCLLLRGVVHVVCVVNGGGVCNWSGSSLLFSPSCVRCYSIVGLGLCLCGGVVSLWNGGSGLCVGQNGGEWR